MIQTMGDTIWVWIIGFIGIYVFSLLLAAIYMYLDKKGVYHYPCLLLGEKGKFIPFKEYNLREGENVGRDNPELRDSGVTSLPTIISNLKES